LWFFTTADFSYTIEDGEIKVTWPYGQASGYYGSVTYDYSTDVKFNEARNESGQLTKLEYGDRTWIVEYNKSNNPKSITRYFNGYLAETYDYDYLPDGKSCTLFEDYSSNGRVWAKEVNVWGTYGSKTKVVSSELYWDSENYAKKEWEYDEDGDITVFRIYSGAGNQWILDEYQINYYSDHTGNEAVIVPAPTAYAYGGTLYI
jgi:hypothetical protein